MTRSTLTQFALIAVTGLLIPASISAQSYRPANTALQTSTAAVEWRVAGGCRPGADPAQMSPSAALGQGWCLMELNRAFEAIAAFERAAGSSNKKTREDANYGRSLAYMRKGLSAEASASIRSGSNSPERLREINSAALTENALNAYRGGNYPRAAALLEQRRQLGGMPLDLLVLLGWSYHKSGRRQVAKNLWNAAAQAGSVEAAQALRDIAKR